MNDEVRAPKDEPQHQLDLGPLPHLVGYMLRRAQLAVFQDFNRRFAETDIRPADYGVLTVIAHNPGLTQSAIGDALGIQRSNLVNLIERLRRRKLIRREPAADDRRAYALSLTEDGRTLLATLDAIRIEHEAKLVNRIGAPLAKDFLDVLHRLASTAED